jgi:hypothetical protein
MQHSWAVLKNSARPRVLPWPGERTNEAYATSLMGPEADITTYSAAFLYRRGL